MDNFLFMGKEMKIYSDFFLYDLDLQIIAYKTLIVQRSLRNPIAVPIDAVNPSAKQSYYSPLVKFIGSKTLYLLRPYLRDIDLI